MPYSRPTLTEIAQAGLQDVQAARLPGVDGLLPFAVLRVLVWALAGMTYENYGFEDYIAQQAVPWTATDEYLAGWGALKGVFPKEASPAVLQATFSGTNGVAIANGTAVATLDGAKFTVTSGGTVSGGSVTVQITAVTPGTAGNYQSGTQVAIATGLSGINGNGTIGTSVSAGTDAEGQEAYRTRVLAVYANPPQGGSQADYVNWAMAVPGVTRAWADPAGVGAGTVVVYTMFDVANVSQGGFPQGTNGVASLETRDTVATGDQLTVANGLYPLRPVTALVYSCAPLPVQIIVALTVGAAFPDTVQQLVVQALQDLFLRIGTPLGMTLHQSDVEGAINSVPGASAFQVDSPGTILLGVGGIPVLDSVQYTVGFQT